MPSGSASDQPINSIQDAVRHLYELSVGVIGNGADRHERPHKPTLILAALDLIAQGRATPDRIPWNQALRDRFTAYFDIVRSDSDGNTPENPFFFLKNDGIWQAFLVDGATPQKLTRTPLVSEFDRVWACFCDGLERFVVTPVDRMFLRQALISRYFPSHRQALMEIVQEGSRREASGAARMKEDSEEFKSGRSSAFRRKILEIYDYQCAACGLRIRLPDSDLTFVDAAHLIPFSESTNDHPTNGIALCKNHHWAMDRHLIAPSPAGVWKASGRLIRHRSPGEAQLLELVGSRLLPPIDPAFAPSADSLKWRYEHLATA